VDEQSDGFLTDTAYVVLGLLSFGQRLTGYEVRQWADGSVRFFWSTPAMSQIYRELGRLEAAGFVSAHDEAEGDRSRTAYGITRKGRAELRRWVQDAPFEPPTIRHPAALRVFFGDDGSREQLVELLREHHRWVTELLADLAEVDAAIAGEGFGNAPVIATWGHRFYGAERRATAEAITQLSDSA
jgi:DNA-binding PadR family transcriptional regulator